MYTITRMKNIKNHKKPGKHNSDTRNKNEEKKKMKKRKQGVVEWIRKYYG